MSANFVGREKGYRNVEGFSEGSKSLAEAFSPAATYKERIGRLFEEVAGMGFQAIDLWTAHCDPQWATRQHFDGLLAARERHGVQIVSLAGGTGGDLAIFEKVCQLAWDIGCPLLGMGSRLLPDKIDQMSALLDQYDLTFAFENHPNEPTPEDILHKIGGGSHPRFGVALDTGWLGTNDYPVLEAIDKLRPYLRLIHLKNVQAPGGHVSAPWDEGCVDVKAATKRLKDIGYQGWISLEYEPFDHDPTEYCRLYRQEVEKWWREF